ncbi:MAG: hypothetical protein AUK63_1848 [bacterium P3]|nr:MAG: hypothetical protein AUK63_1848 [bacterium P3]KWW35868.1 MAG: hypothetical protein F083_2358 [bacterium F083]
MKRRLHIILILLALFIMAACHDNRHDKTEESSNTQVPRTTPIEEVTPPDISRADDTLCYKGYVFFSQPVPKAVKARMQGKSLPESARIGFDELRYLTLYHYDFEGRIQQGEMVCNKAIAHDLLCIFRTLFAEAYPINSIRLVDDFDASDEASMQANNSSCFNYRTIAGSWRLSQHAFGMAVDINPLQNPCVRGTRIRPSTAIDYVDRSKDFPHKIDEKDFCKKTFDSFGFRWGGHWRSVKDYQHFERRK